MRALMILAATAGLALVVSAAAFAQGMGYGGGYGGHMMRPGYHMNYDDTGYAPGPGYGPGNCPGWTQGAMSGWNTGPTQNAPRTGQATQPPQPGEYGVN